jgi:transposase InsO family protein
MPWKVSDVVKERWQFVLEWESQDWSLAELCWEYEITRATGYKWLNRYETKGGEALRDQRRAPHRHPNQTSEEMEKAILEVRAQHSRWGARKIQAVLKRPGEQRQGSPVPARSTIGAILKQHGLTVGRKKRLHAEPSPQPLAPAESANAVWCIDFKGWFRTGDGKRCDPLTITDGYSRYLLRCQGVGAADTVHTRAVMEGAFLEYGLPERIRSDNGAPFGSNGRGGLTSLAVWWMRLGIQPERIQPGKPQQNGSHERMHLTLKQETAQPPAGSLRSQQRRFDAFRQEYNDERPHEALQMSTPGQHYQPSSRSYPRRLPEPVYPAEWEVRWVGQSGQFKLWSTEVFASHALAGQSLGLHPLKPRQERYWKVYFMSYELGVLDVKERLIWAPAEWGKRAAVRSSPAGGEA